MVGASCNLFINANGNSKKFLSKNNPIEDFDLSVASVRRSLIDFKFSRYVFLSSCDVYPDSTNTYSTIESSALDIKSQSPYGFHKFLAEQCVQHTAKDWLIIRQGGFVGENLIKNSVYDVLNGEKLWLQPGSQNGAANTTSFTYIAGNTCDGVINRFACIYTFDTTPSSPGQNFVQPWTSINSPACRRPSSPQATGHRARRRGRSIPCRTDAGRRLRRLWQAL